MVLSEHFESLKTKLMVSVRAIKSFLMTMPMWAALCQGAPTQLQNQVPSTSPRGQNKTRKFGTSLFNQNLRSGKAVRGLSLKSGYQIEILKE